MLNDIIGTVVAVAMSIGGAFGGLADFLRPDPTTSPLPIARQQPSPTLPGNVDPFHGESAQQQDEGAVLGESTAAPEPTTIINLSVVERIVERAVPFPFSPVTLNDLPCPDDNSDCALPCWIHRRGIIFDRKRCSGPTYAGMI